MAKDITVKLESKARRKDQTMAKQYKLIIKQLIT